MRSLPWKSFLLFFLLNSLVVFQAGAAENTGKLSGQLLNEAGKPISYGVVSFFDIKNGLPMDQGVVRRIPEQVVRVQGEGMFSARLPAGSYYIGALQRDTGKGPGPPRGGEKFFFALDGKGQLRTFSVNAGQIVDVGGISGTIPKISITEGNYFTAEGKVLYEDGRPFAGALVTIKKNMAAPRPMFISGPTDADGKYSIKLPPGENYYFVALENLHGGRPLSGDHVGSYGVGSPVPDPQKNTANPPFAAGRKDAYLTGRVVAGKPGEVKKGIDITMFKMPDPKEIRSIMLNQAEAQQSPGQKPNSDSKK